MDGSQLLQVLCGVLDQVKVLLNSVFVSAFLSALAGAGFGVWGAQRLSNRTVRKSELLESLAEANAMIVLASVVTNEVLSIKKQHILPACKDYFDRRESFIDAKARIIAGERLEQPLQLQANFISIPPPSIPVEALRNKAYAAKRIPGRSIALVSVIDQYFCLLSHSLESRTEQIRAIRANRLAGEDLADVYFGLDSQRKGIDSTYFDSMRAIQLYADDVVFFGVELVADLEAYTARLCEILKEIYSDVPKRTTADFSEARDSGLLPPRKNYESWLKGYPTTES